MYTSVDVAFSLKSLTVGRSNMWRNLSELYVHIMFYCLEWFALSWVRSHAPINFSVINCDWHVILILCIHPTFWDHFSRKNTTEQIAQTVLHCARSIGLVYIVHGANRAYWCVASSSANWRKSARLLVISCSVRTNCRVPDAFAILTTSHSSQRWNVARHSRIDNGMLHSWPVK